MAGLTAEELQKKGVKPINSPESGFTAADLTAKGIQPMSPTPDNHVGIFHQAVQDLAQPFLKIPATISSGFIPTIFDVFGAHDTAKKLRESAISQGIDYGYLGQVKPIGADQFTAAKSGEISPGTAVVRTGEEMVSTGAQIASWFVGVGEEEAVAETGAAAAKTGLMSKALGFVKEALPFSILQGIGAGSADLSKGKDVGTATLDTLTNTAGNIVGFLGFKGVSELLTKAGGAILRNTTVSAANKALVDTLSKVFGTDVESISPSVVKEVTAEVDAAHKELIKGIGESIKTKSSPEELWNGVVEKVDPYIQQVFKEPDNIFKDFYSKAPPISGGFSETMEVVNSANEYLDKVYGKGSDLSGKVSIEEFKAAGDSATAGLRDDSPLQKYVNEIVSKIGEDGGGSIPASDVEKLALKREIIPGRANDTEDKFMNQFTATLKKDMVSFLKSNPETSPLVELYNKGQKAAELNKNVLSDVLMQSLKTVSTDAGDFLDTKIFTKKTPNEREVKTLLQALGGEGSDTQKKFSELAFNRIIDRAQSLSADITEGGKFIKDFVKNWSNTGLISAEHINMLDHYSDLMMNKSGDYLDAVTGMIGKGTKFEAPAAKLEEKTSQLSSLKTFAKTLGNKPLFEVNSDGSFNMTNLLEALQKSNDDKNTFGPLIEQFAKFNPEEIAPNKAKELIRTGLGATLLATGHTWWGAGMTMKGLTGIVSGEGKVGAKEVADMAAELIGKIDEKTGEPYLESSWVTDLMSNKVTVVKQAIKKLSQAYSGKVVKQIVLPDN